MRNRQMRLAQSNRRVIFGRDRGNSAETVTHQLKRRNIEGALVLFLVCGNLQGGISFFLYLCIAGRFQRDTNKQPKRQKSIRDVWSEDFLLFQHLNIITSMHLQHTRAYIVNVNRHTQKPLFSYIQCQCVSVSVYIHNYARRKRRFSEKQTAIFKNRQTHRKNDLVLNSTVIFLQEDIDAGEYFLILLNSIYVSSNMYSTQ